jgi:O-acetyl-ADP-ribose deacetylase (regulator of RNase III)
VIGFEIWRGNIVDLKADALVNSANGSLYDRGSGTDLAIRMAAGDALEKDCQRLRATRLREGLPEGEAVATTAGDLPARWVIHTAAPIYSISWDRSRTLASCYHNCLRTADELGAKTVGFPPLAAGTRGWPIREAAAIAVRSIIATPTGVVQAILVALNGPIEAAFMDAFGGDLGQWERFANDNWTVRPREVPPDGRAAAAQGFDLGCWV